MSIVFGNPPAATGGGGGSGIGFTEVQRGSAAYGAASSFTQINVVFPVVFSGVPDIYVMTADPSGTPTYATLWSGNITATDFDVFISGGLGPFVAGTFTWLAFIL